MSNNPFDRLKRKTDEAARIKKEAEEKEREARRKATVEGKRQYKKHEKMVTQVLRDMYNKVFRDHLVQPEHKSKIGLQERDKHFSYVITSGYFEDQSPWTQSRSELGYYVKVFLLFDSQYQANGFDCYIGGASGKTYDFSPRGLEKLLAELYEEDYFSR